MSDNIIDDIKSINKNQKSNMSMRLKIPDSH